MNSHKKVEIIWNKFGISSHSKTVREGVIMQEKKKALRLKQVKSRENIKFNLILSLFPDKNQTKKILKNN